MLQKQGNPFFLYKPYKIAHPFSNWIYESNQINYTMCPSMFFG